MSEGIPLEAIEKVRGDLGMVHIIHISQMKNMGTACGDIGNLSFKEAELEEILDLPYVVALIYKEDGYPDSISFMAVKLKKPYLATSKTLTDMISNAGGYMRSELQDGWIPPKTLEGWDLLESE